MRWESSLVSQAVNSPPVLMFWPLAAGKIFPSHTCTTHLWDSFWNIIFLGYLNSFTSAKGLLSWVSHKNQVCILQATLLFELSYLINVQHHGFHLTCTMSLKAVHARWAQIYVQLKLINKEQSFADNKCTKLLCSLLSIPVKIKLISGKLCSHSLLKRQKIGNWKIFQDLAHIFLNIVNI